jgi:hypothetical protein
MTIKLEEMTTQGHCLLCSWIAELEQNLSNKLKLLKRDKMDFFNDGENANTISNLAIELEAYLNEHTNNVEKLMSQFSNIDELEKINGFMKDLSDGSVNSENFFENKLIQLKTDNLTKIYEYYQDKVKTINDKIINKLKEEYNIFNY